MSKMIAVCGAPGSGKTTAALKIAEEIYYAKKGSVIFFSPDLNVPCLAYIFPNCKEAELIRSAWRLTARIFTVKMCSAR